MYIWLGSWRCGCLVTWFCYLLIEKPGNKTAAPLWPKLMWFAGHIILNLVGVSISLLLTRKCKFKARTLKVIFIFHLNSSHYSDVIMSPMASQNTSLTSVCSTVYSVADQRKHQSSAVADQRKHQSSAPLAFVKGIHRSPVNSPHKGPVTRKMFPFDDVVMKTSYIHKV